MCLQDCCILPIVHYTFPVNYCTHQSMYYILLQQYHTSRQASDIPHTFPAHWRMQHLICWLLLPQPDCAHQLTDLLHPYNTDQFLKGLELHEQERIANKEYEQRLVARKEAESVLQTVSDTDES